MKIITIPHQTLRETATPVSADMPDLELFVTNLKNTLVKNGKPKGVGLAAPQVDKLWRVFVTHMMNPETKHAETEIYLNPQIVKHSPNQTMGPKKDPALEGCLSMPGLWGPIPRWEWITLEYQVLEKGKLVTKSLTASDFAARVIQHEYDHLDGILFTDYSLEYDLPVYIEEKDRLVPMPNRSLLELV